MQPQPTDAVLGGTDRHWISVETHGLPSKNGEYFVWLEGKEEVWILTFEANHWYRGNTWTQPPRVIYYQPVIFPSPPV